MIKAKGFIALLLLLCFLTSAFACSSGDKNKDLFDLLLSSTGSDETLEALSGRLYVIIPSNSSAELSAKAKTLADAIASKTELSVVLKYDNEPTSDDEKSLYILLGNTNRLASKEAMSGLKMDDYICKWDGNSIILGGRYDSSTVAAIDRFTSEILPGVSPQSIMVPNAHFEYTKKYEVSSLKLNGYDLYDYTLVYSATNTNNEKEIAEAFRNHIASQSGYWLEVIPSTSLDAEGGKTVLFGNDRASQQSMALYDAGIEPTDTGISVFGKNSYSLSEAMSRFAQMLLGNAQNGAASLDISSVSGFSVPYAELKLCAASVFSKDGADEEYLLNFIDGLSSILSKYDAVLFRDVSPEVKSDIIANVSSGCAYKICADNEAAILVYSNSSLSDANISLSGDAVVATLKQKQTGETFRLIALGDNGNSFSQDLLADGHGILIKPSVPNGDNGGLSLGENAQAFFDGKAYSRSVYVDNARLKTVGFDKVIYNGQKCSKLFLSATVGARYAASFYALTNTVD